MDDLQYASAPSPDGESANGADNGKSNASLGDQSQSNSDPRDFRDYLAMGWAIFPLHSIVRGQCSCGKPECNNQGKHPRTINGVKDASKDPHVIETWWTTWPDANIGLACGAQSGVVVVDIDQKHGGYASFENWEQERGWPLDTSLIALSGGGGRHIFLQYPYDDVPLPNRNGMWTGVDVRSDGGYVVLAPSNHLSGTSYQWLNWGRPILPAPVDLLQAIRNTGGSSSRGDLPDAATILEGIAEGSRDDTLFRWACRLRRQLNDDRAAVEILVLEAARRASPPFPEREARRKVEQAFKQDHRDESEISVGAHANTDSGNALRFVDLHASVIRWVLDDGSGSWRIWRGTHWERATDEQALTLTRDVVDVLLQDAQRESDDSRRQTLSRWATATQGVARLKAMLTLAKSDPRLWARQDDFDANPYLLNFVNGTVDLRSGIRSEHDQRDMISRLIRYDYIPNAVAPRWEQLLNRAVRGAGDGGATVEFLQRFLGYALIGANAEQVMMIGVGPPRVGKSKLIEIVRDLAGLDYCHTSRPDLLVKKRFGHHDSEVSSLRGKRFVTISETDGGMDLDEARVKDLIGANKVATRELYDKSEREARVTWTILVATNEPPNVEHWDAAIARRMVVVPFGPSLEQHEVDLHIADEILAKEPEGVLAWLVRGAVTWWRQYSLTGQTGLSPSPAVAAATLRYGASNDHVALFIEERCVVEEGRKVLCSTLHKEYRHWRNKSGAEVKRGALYARMLEVPNVTKDARFFYGLDIVAERVELWHEPAARGLLGG